MQSYLSLANGIPLYLIVAVVLLFVAGFCVLFMVKSYRAGIKLGMEKKVLVRAITSSASFTVIPSISILLGVIALSGSLGIPVSWLRLSVIGNLQYEATVASIAAEGMGTKLDSSVLTMDNLVTIMLVMTIGIIWGCLCSILFLKKYSNKLKLKQGTKKEGGKKGFSSFAMVAMFIGLCATFVGSYIAQAIVSSTWVPVFTVVVAALSMALFEYLAKNKGIAFFETFSLAGSMLIAMTAAVLISL
jgi:heme/copper-type cytochrome/quinol oxidase subunit 2